jgi:hypothetical protein
MPWSRFAAFGLLWLACTPAQDETSPRLEPAEHAVPPTAEPPIPLAIGSTGRGESAGPQPSAPVAPDDAPRVYSKSRYVWIRTAPDPDSKWIGYLWVGGSVRLESTEPLPGSGSCPSYYAVEPEGFVCVDGDHATLDPTDPTYRAVLAHAPKVDRPLPYQYGESLGLKRHFEVEGIDVPKWPAKLHDTAHLDVRPRSSIAWTEEVAIDGATWLWASDLSLAPKDKVKPYPAIGFRGVQLAGDVQLPIAFFRRASRPKYRLGDDSEFSKTDLVWDHHTWIGLTGESKRVAGKKFLKTIDDAHWVQQTDAVIVHPRVKRTPWGGPVALRGAPSLPGSPGRRKTWIELAAVEGWLIAYEDDRPVFATLISAGRLGAEKRAPEPPFVPPSTTPLGRYSISRKWVTKKLITPHVDADDFIEAEVPWTQHFFDKYHLHAAYWHDRWGYGQSGGCVNLSPIDAKWLFEWTEPSLPPGWHAMRVTDAESSTRVVIHR